jgi:molecular chaperone GrpE
LTLESTDKERLLQQFKNYLNEPGQEWDENDSGSPLTTDLYSLFVELAGLKNEVKIESRQFKEALDQFQAAMTPLQSGYEALQTTIAQQRSHIESEHKETLRPLLLELLELRDRMAAGEAIANRKERSFFSRFCQKEKQLLTAVNEGVAMSARRLDQILAAHQVKPFVSVGQSLDPVRMRATETVSDPDIPHGEVTAELRKGYLWNNELLRFAEVIVNK